MAENKTVSNTVTKIDKSEFTSTSWMSSFSSLFNGKNDNAEKSSTVSNDPVLIDGENGVSVSESSKNSKSEPYKPVYANDDKRVSLTATPKSSVYGISNIPIADKLFDDKEVILQVLGSRTTNIAELACKKIYGYLFRTLGSSSGLIFPYTPTISFNRKVNYETVGTYKSNSSYNIYKNTPFPTISINASFTADNRDNAMHMLSAIWFLGACCRSTYGYQQYAVTDNESGIETTKTQWDTAINAGLTPPVLYLNGYDRLNDNIPVLINNYNYSLPNESHYVHLEIDLKNPGENGVGFNNVYNVSKKIYTYSEALEAGMKKGDVFSASVDDTTVSTQSFNKNEAVLSFWLPTKLDVKIGLLAYYNPLKMRDCWNLNDFKTGAIFYRDMNDFPKSYTINWGSLYVMNDDELEKSFNNAHLDSELLNREVRQKIQTNNSTPVSTASKNADIKANEEAVEKQILNPLYDKFGQSNVIITSRTRTQSKNNKIAGSSKTSQHLTGEAVDIQVNGKNSKEVFDWIKNQSGIKYDQLIYETYNGKSWVHISYNNSGTSQRHMSFGMAQGSRNTDISYA